MFVGWGLGTAWKEEDNRRSQFSPIVVGLRGSSCLAPGAVLAKSFHWPSFLIKLSLYFLHFTCGFYVGGGGSSLVVLIGLKKIFFPR